MSETPSEQSDNAKVPSLRFFSAPGHVLSSHPAPLALPQLLEPEGLGSPDSIEKALAGAEFRHLRARDRLRQLLMSEEPPRMSSPPHCGPAAVFAQPPNDLPALLRLADQLDALASEEGGEKALVWMCENCGTRYAVPVSLVRSVSIRCERCGNPVELSVPRSLGEESLLDPSQGVVNTYRRQLAEFFREAMARGWPVLVCAPET